MTGGYLRPSLYNRPLPRLNPQPTSISVMIFRRRRARSRRVLESRKWKNWVADLGLERQFEADLATHTRLAGEKFEPIYDDMRSWRKPMKLLIRDINRSFRLDLARSRTPYSKDMLAAIKGARRNKIINKTREKSLARKGYYTNRVVKQLNKGPPAHVLTTMSKKQLLIDRVSRWPGDNGFVGTVKAAKGMRLKHCHPWDVEAGMPDNRKALDDTYCAVIEGGSLRAKF